MNLDTYKSTIVDGLFVTLPSNAGEATIRVVDELSSLGLQPMLHHYEIADDERSAFARFVLTEIVLKGYATHGRDGLPRVR